MSILSNPYPLSAYPQWESRSLKQAQEFCQNGSFPQVDRLDALGHRDAFHLRTASVELDSIKLMSVNSSGHRIRLIDNDRLGVLVPLANRIGVDDGRTERSAGPGELLIPGLGPRTTTVSRNYTGLVVLLPSSYIGRCITSSEPPYSASELEHISRTDTRRCRCLCPRSRPIHSRCRCRSRGLPNQDLCLGGLGSLRCKQRRASWPRGPSVLSRCP